MSAVACPRPVNSRPPGLLPAAECIAAGECGCDIGNPLPWRQFELPLPPSVNRRVGKLGNKSPEVVKWQKRADPCWLLIKREQNIPTFYCKVRMEMICGVQPNWDLDNRIKPMQDYLERVRVVENDRLIRDVRAVDSEGSVPKGRVIVRLRPWVSA